MRLLSILSIIIVFNQLKCAGYERPHILYTTVQEHFLMHHRAFSCAALTLALVCLVDFVARPSAAATALQSDYTSIAGFPRTDPKGSIFFASPAVVDLDGDGRPEILTIDGDACVYGWRANGTPLPGFPLKTGADCRTTPRSTTQLAF